MYLILLVAVLLIFSVIDAKVYDRCELAKDLQYVYEFPKEEISTWVCIVQHESNFNTSAVNRGSGDHGLFQISQLFWCSVDNVGLACNANCASFRDNDISDDVKCVKTIFKEHSRISGNGFNAWTVYGYYCKRDTSKYLDGCREIEIDTIGNILTEDTLELDEDGYHFPTLPLIPKIYNRCELAKELKDVHQVPTEELSTWICIAHHESSFNTSANNKGSGDHGIFQISELYWCSKFIKAGGCNAKCSQFRDTDITDDISCARTIFNKQKAITGDGFTAWSIYPQYCKGDTKKYIGGCPGVDETLTINKQSKTLDILKPALISKIYNRCELARELKYKHNVPDEQISKWVCIAERESNLNTSSLGNGDHGIFQISEQYWCSPYGKGSGCNAFCGDFRDHDLTDDVACIEIIFNEHVGISGDGFNAWAVYPFYCKGDTSFYTSNCFKGDDNSLILQSKQQSLYPFSQRITSKNNIISNVEGDINLSTKIETNHRSSTSNNKRLYDNTFSSFTNPAKFDDLITSESISRLVSTTPDIIKSSNNSYAYLTSKSTEDKIILKLEPDSKDLSNGTESAKRTLGLYSLVKKSSLSDFSNDSIRNTPNSRQTARQMNTRPRPSMSRILLDPYTGQPFERQRPHRPPGPPRPPGPQRPAMPGPLRPQGPARPQAPSRPQVPPRPPPARPSGSRPRPPLPPLTTLRPFSWNNLPGVIFTLWPSSTTGPVSTSVYSTTPKQSLYSTETTKLTEATKSAKMFGIITDSNTQTVRATKREPKLGAINVPGYIYSTTPDGFELIPNKKV
ncbi:unnamed protein product [Diabrotica balteata]|uniref:lysozyme n=1 Tax=Diabrotica balteata TaxID=107213 RepID=A0A9N9TD80_DIABA|nr:unnamed protein product [Diabrotica balteata]